MDIQSFQRSLIRRINDRLPDGVRAKSRKIKRNNDTASDAIVPVFDEPRLSGAVLYTEDLYQVYLAGEQVDRIAELAAEALQKTLPEEYTDGSLFSRETLETQTVIRLISRSRNEDRIRDLAYRPFLDLALVYSIVVPYPGKPGDTAMALVTKELLRDTGLTEEELYDLASVNSGRILGTKVFSMEDLLKEGSGTPELSGKSLPCIYVATNRMKRYGASVMAYSNVIPELSGELGRDLIILPSSVHELILYPLSGQDPQELKTLVKSVNESEVSPEEVLSDSVYLFRREEGRLEILA